MQVGLHHDREQGLVDAPPSIEQGGRTSRCAAWGTAATGHRRSWTGCGGGSRSDGPCGRRSAPTGRRRSSRSARFQDFEQGSMVQGHRPSCPSVRTLQQVSLPSHDGRQRRDHHAETGEPELHHLRTRPAAAHPPRSVVERTQEPATLHWFWVTTSGGDPPDDCRVASRRHGPIDHNRSPRDRQAEASRMRIGRSMSRRTHHGRFAGWRLGSGA